MVKDTIPVDGKARWVIVAWNPVHQGLVKTRLDLGTAISKAVVHDYASPATEVLEVPALATGFDVQIGYEPVLLVVDCDVGGICVVSVTSDPLGGIIAGLLVAAVTLIATLFLLATIQRRKVTSAGVV
ncbi:MAG: hypothetical protein GYA24_24185 [Candidatus Lokiarchaeota archaeon]|nr:hypothetical protein [Candidatus Lokiarchaeota archaeon]